MGFKNITESESLYNNLESKSVFELLEIINAEDAKVPAAIHEKLHQIEALVKEVSDKMLSGGRLFYVGAGTSGRLGVVDASEIPPTYGMPPGLVVGIIAGSDIAIKNAVENAEDDRDQGWEDLKAHQVSDNDFVIGISASGTAPYVVSALEECRKNNITTGCITNNPGSPLAQVADYPIEIVVGPEVVTGSTRMKSGTSQKLVLNMISTAVMIQLGRVEGNRMVNMQLTNAKLVDRGVKMLQEKAKIEDYEVAKDLLLKHKSVKKALGSLNNS